MSDILIIKKEEHHFWKTCPCDTCVHERGQRSAATNRLIELTPHQAHVFGYISHRSPGGSLVRAIRAKQQ